MTLRMRSSDLQSMYSKNSGSTRPSDLISLTAARQSASVGKNSMLETRGCQGATYTSASEMIPKIPSDPTNMSMRSMPSWNIGPAAFFTSVLKS